MGIQLKSTQTMALALASINVPALAGFGKAAPKTPPKPAFAYGLPGGANILGEFDPAGFLEGKSQLEVYRYREAELTHGRVSMLASLGFIVQEKFHPLFSGDGGPAIDQIPALPAWLWVVMIGGIGFAESQRISIGWQETGSSPHPHTGQGVQGKVVFGKWVGSSNRLLFQVSGRSRYAHILPCPASRSSHPGRRSSIRATKHHRHSSLATTLVIWASTRSTLSPRTLLSSPSCKRKSCRTAALR